jgi:serine/threonine protein kinase
MDDLDLGATIKGLIPGQQLFKRYTLVRMVGRGGMGVVWLAKDNELGREMALKFLPELVATDRSSIDDLKREVRRAMDLSHPNIVKIYDFVTDGRTAAVSMEFIAGDTLSSLRIDEPGKVFSPEKLAPWITQLCAALDYAHHDAQVVHRDLKPANLMIDARGRLKVLDFGLAASLAESVSRVSRQSSGSGTPA